MPRSPAAPPLAGVHALAREVALPHTPQHLRVRSRLFLVILGTFLALALPLALLESWLLLGGLHRTFAERALRESRLMASLPPVVVALEGRGDAGELPALVERYRTLLGADYIVITDRQTRRLSHPNPERLGQKMVGGDFQSFLRGQSVTETVEGTLGRSVRAKVPVLSSGGQVLGLASVGFLLPRVRDVFWGVIRTSLPWYLAVLALALLLASWLARRVRREMLGLEPEQIAGGFLHYRAVLRALDEGVLVLRGEELHMVNPQARALLGTGPQALPLPLPEPLRPLARVAAGSGSPTTHTVTVAGRPLLAGVVEAGDGSRVVTLRDLAQVRALADELTQSRRYAELLRAQTHEFSNRLHTLAGLLHLGEVAEALRLIDAQAARGAAHGAAVSRLRSLRLAALVLGKYERAAELGVTLTLDPLCDLPPDLPPEVLDLLELAVGNLVENACEAAQGSSGGALGPEVRLLLAADPEGLVLEVRDSGPGIPPALRGRELERGVSSKGPGRGVGLALVQGRARALGATLRWARVSDGAREWTCFTLELPSPPEPPQTPEQPCPPEPGQP